MSRTEQAFIDLRLSLTGRFTLRGPSVIFDLRAFESLIGVRIAARDNRQKTAEQSRSALAELSVRL